VEYYLENAKFRLARVISYADHHMGLRLTEPLMPFLRLRGTLGAELTRYEWESAHYALRALFKVNVRIASLFSLFSFAIFFGSTKRIFPDSGVP
jgi:hypothetical protein